MQKGNGRCRGGRMTKPKGPNKIGPTNRGPNKIGPTARVKLNIWDKSVQPCTKCDISKLCKHKVTYFTYCPRPTKTIDILFIGEAPGQVEYAEREPFIGPSGAVMREIIQESVPPHLSYCITNSILCTPFTDDTRYTIRTPSLSEVRECAAHLTRLIRYINPRKIILVGRIAEKAIKHVTCPIPPTTAIRHPSAIMQDTKSTYEFDNAVLTIQRYLEDI